MGMFDELSKIKLNNRFKIHSYTSSKTGKNALQSGRNGSSSDNIILDKSIKDIETTTSKLILEYEDIYREMMKKRAELAKEIEEAKGFGAKGEVLVMYHKADSDLLGAAVRIIDSKAKAQADRIKAVREERKFYVQRTDAKPSAEQGTQSQATIRLDSPLVTMNTSNLAAHSVSAFNNSSMHTVNTGGAENMPDFSDMIINPNRAVSNESGGAIESAIPLSPMEKLLNKKKTDEVIIDEKEEMSTPLEESTTQQNVTPVVDSNYYSNIALSVDGITGAVNKTLEDKRIENMNLIAQRLSEENSNADLSDKTRIGLDYNTALNKLKQNHLGVKEKLFIDLDSGMYYLKGFTKDSEGNDIEYPEYSGKGLLHIGNLKFHGSKPLVKTQFYEEYIPFEIVNDIDGMNDFYRSEWSKPEANMYVIDDESELKTIERIYSHKDE